MRVEGGRKIFRDLDRQLELSLRRPDPDGNTIEFIASTQGLLTGGSSKGYIYSTKNLTPLYDSLDQPAPSSQGKYVYKRLKTNWYLYYYAE